MMNVFHAHPTGCNGLTVCTHATADRQNLDIAMTELTMIVMANGIMIHGQVPPRGIRIAL